MASGVCDCRHERDQDGCIDPLALFGDWRCRIVPGRADRPLLAGVVA